MRKVFCVFCGQRMDDETEHGIICTLCYGQLYGQPRAHSQPLTIQHCHHCGQPLLPVANEIIHSAEICQSA